MGCLAHVRPVLHHSRVVFGFGIISMLMRFPRRELRGLCAGRSSPISLPPSARSVMWSAVKLMPSGPAQPTRPRSPEIDAPRTCAA